MGIANAFPENCPLFLKTWTVLVLGPTVLCPSWKCHSVFAGHLLCVGLRIGHSESFMSKRDTQMPPEHGGETDGGGRGGESRVFREAGNNLA